MTSAPDLSVYGIRNATEVLYNPSYDQLYAEETRPDLEGFEKAQVTELGAVNVRTGIFTGRSPKDKFIVEDDVSRDTLWWNTPENPNDNKPISPEVWNDLKALVTEQLSGTRLFVVDTF